MTININTVRADKWLWACRFYKTRQLAIKALKNGKVSFNKRPIKPASNIKIGDRLIVKRGLFEEEIEVLGLSEKRGSATIAQTLYRETAESIKQRKILQAQMAQQPKIDIDRRKPDKRGIRTHRAFKRNIE